MIGYAVYANTEVEKTTAIMQNIVYLGTESKNYKTEEKFLPRVVRHFCKHVCTIRMHKQEGETFLIVILHTCLGMCLKVIS
jgi:urate oxidase